MAYENFPFTDLHTLNMDWLLATVKEIKQKLELTNIPQLVNDKIDQMVTDGTLSQIINQELLGDINTQVTTLTGDAEELYKRTAEAQVVMLCKPDAQTADPQRGYSLCMVIHNKNFCVVYDMGNDDAARLLSYLHSAGIHKIDAMIISHYHNDHVTLQAVKNVLNSDIDVGTWYLPHGAINWESYIGTNYSAVQTAIKSAIVAAGDTFVEPTVESFPVELQDCRLQFYNVSSGYFADYYPYKLDEDLTVTDHTNYNNFSMCCRVLVGDTVLALTGDIEQPAQDHMAGMIRGADILQIPHHGLDLRDSDAFINSMSAKIFLTAAYGLAKERRLRYNSNDMLHQARSLGTSVSTIDQEPVYAVMGAQGCYLVPAFSGTPTPTGSFGTKIPVGDDLNNYQVIGKTYYIETAAEAAQIANVPKDAGAGRLYIISSNENSRPDYSFIQIYLEAFSYGNPGLYIRYQYEGVWRSWFKFDYTIVS